MPGDKVGSIRIEKRLASGGMSDVFLGFHEALRIRVAVKTLKTLDPNIRIAMLEQFATEARALAKLIHPNIVRVLDFNDKHPPYIVQEYIDGDTLYEILRQRQTLDPQEAIRVILEIAQALRAAHQLGIVHRDVKPSNIFFTSDGRIMLGDFGIALLYDEKTVLKEEPHFLTPPYSPIELFKGSLVDQRADIYSLGITFYNALLGTIPPNALERGGSEIVIPNTVPDYIRPVLTSMIRHNASERVRDISDVIDGLKLIHDPLLGLDIKGYRLIRTIGRGGQGKVYFAEGPNGPVAMKILLTDEGIKPEARDRFRLEGKVSKYLNHNNIVRVQDYGEAVLTMHEETRKLHFLIMDLIKGRDLEEFITSKREPNVDQSVYIVCELLLALDYAHEEGLIHRDVKARNVLISNDGEVKLTDFGLCKYNAEYNPHTSFSFTALTDTDSILGSPHFMSPEQISAGKAVTRVSDIYSCGVLLFYLCTHQLPFTGSTVMNILVGILSQPTPDPRRLNKKIPKRLARIIMKTLEKDPLNRFRTCSETERLLRSGLTNLSSMKVDLADEVSANAAEAVRLSAPNVFALIEEETQQATIRLEDISTLTDISTAEG